MKKQLLAVAIAGLAAANANAFTYDPNTTSVLVISGASAQRTYFQQLLTVGTGNTATNVCKGQVQWFADNNGSNAAGKNYDVWYCAKETANPLLANAKANLLIYKRSAGGSDLGVAPIITPTALGMLNINDPSCTAPASFNANTVVSYCSASTLVNLTPDLGVSDVDPGQFVGKNVSAGFNPVNASDLSKLKIQSTSAVVFGEQVTKSLFNALQAAQVATGQLPATCTPANHTEACMPSLSSALIADIHAGKVFDWDQIQVGSTGLGLYSWTVANSPANQPAVSAVHVVRRANGSGTQTQHGINFLNYPCDLAASASTLAANDVAGQGEATTGYVIHEMASAGNVNAALVALETGAASSVLIAGSNTSASTWAGGVRWAVGLNSLEQVTTVAAGKTTDNYEFVKVDGVAPTLANVVAGKYHDWVENTFQYNINHIVTADVAAVRDAIIGDAATPAVLSALNGSLTHTFGNGSYLAQPGNPAVIAHGGAPVVYDATFPATPFARTPNGVNTDNCRVPTLYYDGTNTAPLFSM